MLSHELRTPLTPVLTSLLALEFDGLPEAVPPATMKVSLLTRLKGWVQEVQE